MPESTKIIPFPNRAKARAQPQKTRIAEFAQLSEIIRDKRSGNDVRRLILTAGAAEGAITNGRTWPPGHRS